jgi:hypothetical protein
MSVLTSFMRNIGKPVKSSSKSNNSFPMLNEINANLRNFFNSPSQIGKKQTLMRWYKQTLEVQGLVDKVATDLTGKFHFENVDDSSGRDNIIKANKFAMEVQYKRQKLSQNIDKLVTGESFAQMAFIKDKQIMDAIKKSVGNRPFIETKRLVQLEQEIFKEIKQTDMIIDPKGIDEDLLKPRKYRTIASSTMEIIFDKLEIKGYVQDVGGETVDFSVKEIIRSTFMDVDGKVNGFTSLESALVQLELLRFMWGNMTAIHKNGGAMDKIFILEDGNINDVSYQRIKKQLQKYKLVENKHGNMLFTGKIKIEDLQQLDNMQFKDMGVYITSLLAKLWNIPNSSAGVGVKDGNLKDDTGGNSEKSYWEKIEFLQERDADIDNLQLWIPHFGVKLVYDKKYVQKDVQKETAIQLKLNNVKVVEELAASNKKRLKFDDMVKLIDMEREMFEDIPKEDLELMQSMKDGLTGTKKQLSDGDINNSQAQNNVRDKKRNEQASTQGDSMINTGTGKEWDKTTEIEYKQLIGIDDERVPLETFVRLYNQDRASNPGMPPRIFMRENPDFSTLKFKSTDFVYRTVIDKSLEEDNRVLFMNLGNNIWRL